MQKDLKKRVFPGLGLGAAVLTTSTLLGCTLLAPAQTTTEKAPAKPAGKNSVAAKKEAAAKEATVTPRKTREEAEAAQEKTMARVAAKPAGKLEWPPKLPGGVDVVVDESPELLVKPEHVELKPGVVIAKTPPRIEFSYYPGQDELSELWSVWGDGSTSGTKYYSSIGDHAKPFGRAQVYEYDTATKKMRLLADTTEVLKKNNALPDDMLYTPGKIHSRTDIGSDGWLYYATHRGSASTTNDAHGYKGDWVFRTNPETGVSEIVVAHPIPKHCIPASVLDPERLIFYGSTAVAKDAPSQQINFFAYDVKNGKMLNQMEGGFGRYAILSSSTGAVYWQNATTKQGTKYDPTTNKFSIVPSVPDVRAATQETKDGIVYGVSGRSADLWAFDVKNETLKQLGPGAVATQQYTTSMDVDPSGRYVYYIPGAHGGGIKDGTPIVQYDVKTNTRKVIAFLNEYYTKKYSYAPDGTFGSALSPDGSTLFVTWNGRRVPDAKDWDTVAMTAIHIPASERQP